MNNVCVKWCISSFVALMVDAMYSTNSPGLQDCAVIPTQGRVKGLTQGRVKGAITSSASRVTIFRWTPRFVGFAR